MLFFFTKVVQRASFKVIPKDENTLPELTFIWQGIHVCKIS
jgi:hypothetical protein